MTAHGAQAIGAVTKALVSANHSANASYFDPTGYGAAVGLQMFEHFKPPSIPLPNFLGLKLESAGFIIRCARTTGAYIYTHQVSFFIVLVIVNLLLFYKGILLSAVNKVLGDYER